jgi:hypothetical protein
MVMAIIATFIILELRGTSDCKPIKGQLNDWPKKFTCTSRWLKFDLPVDFCPARYSCECGDNKNCGQDCSCISSQCIPNSYEKSGSVVKLQDLNFDYIKIILPIITGFFLIVSFFIFLNLKITNEKLLVKRIGISIFFILLGIIVLSVKYGITKKVEAKLVNACNVN